MSWDEGDYYAASFSVHKCRRYHARMRDFYRGVHRLILGLTIFAASAAFGATLGHWSTLAASLSAVIACISVLDYAFGTGEAASQHHNLCRRFTRLAERIEQWKPTPENLSKARSQRLRIEADEPSEKRLVDLWAEGEEIRARGGDVADIPPLNRRQVFFGRMFTFGMRRIERWHAEREKQRAANDALAPS